MYIIKNAFRSITRKKGRWLLIGLIVFIISLSACISLSILESAQQSKEDLLSTLSITATIEMNREKMMNSFQASGGEFDKASFKKAMLNEEQLSIDELEKYSGSNNVKDFYYTISTSVNGDDSLEPISTQETSSSQPPMDRGFGSQTDFSLIGYSSDKAMTDFLSGNSAITQGAVFQEGSTENHCIIPSELATYNKLSVNDSITLVDPNDSSIQIPLKIVGIYSNSTTQQGDFAPAQSSYNQILVSSAFLEKFINNDTQLNTRITPTYTFENAEKYNAFCDEVYTLGLDEAYTVSSRDYNSFEQSLTPLENLEGFAKAFLIVILVIGAIILLVINIFNVRERKYEIGVLSAIGMKKHKIAFQFIIEMIIITIIALLLSTAVGAVSSVEIGNKLLENQISSTQEQLETANNGFGREQMGMPNGNTFKNQQNPNNINSFVSEINASTNLAVFGELAGIALLLSLISCFSTVIFILRYNPMKILSTRD